MTKKKFPFMIGADPEFNILFEDKTISADRLMHTLYGKKHRQDSCNMGYKIGSAGSIGWDGCSSTGELRPAPANTPEEVCKNIKTIVSSFAEKIKIFKLMTTSEAAPVGGHIHFQINNKLIGHTTLIDNIHKRLISFYLPVQMGEDIIDVRARTKNNYGKFTDYRVAAVAGQMNSSRCLTPEEEKKLVYTYEFRVPSAEWMTTERTARATIAYLATVWNEIIHNPDNFNKSKELIFNTKSQGLALQEIAMTQYGMITNLMIGKIRKHIKNFEYYKEYEEEIEFILSPNKILTEKKKAGYDMLKGWKIEDNRKPNKRTLLSETKIKTEAKKINIEDLMALITIPYNPDLNVEHFATALKTRIIAVNWKLNNKYFLFGLRKGVNNYIITDNNKHFIKGRDQIKTRLDIKEIAQTFNNMIAKNQESESYRKLTSEDMAKTIYIGIPYEERANMKIKNLINAIYEIEKKNPEHQEIEMSKLFDDTNLNEEDPKDQEQFGKIFLAYNQEKISNVFDNNVIDNGRTRMNSVKEMKRNQQIERNAEEQADQLTDEVLRNAIEQTAEQRTQTTRLTAEMREPQTTVEAETMMPIQNTASNKDYIRKVTEFQRQLNHNEIPLQFRINPNINN